MKSDTLRLQICIMVTACDPKANNPMGMEYNQLSMYTSPGSKHSVSVSLCVCVCVGGGGGGGGTVVL